MFAPHQVAGWLLLLSGCCLVLGADEPRKIRPETPARPKAPLQPAGPAKPSATGGLQQSPVSSPRRMSATARFTPPEEHALQAARAAKLTAGAHQGPAPYLVHYLEFKNDGACEKFKVEGAFVFNRFDRFADAFIEADDNSAKVLDSIRKSEGYLWDEFAGNVYVPPPQIGVKGTSRAVAEQIVSGGVGNLKGQGTIIVIVDTGLDFFNPDFISYSKDGTPSSRLRYFWDTTRDDASGLGSAAPVSYPNGASIGTIYSRDDLNKALRSFKPLITVWDVDGHGTSCAGVAAGNGNSLEGRYQGVAPEAELIGVRLGDSLESAYLLNAICAWVDKVAEKTPAVISCSFGGRDGGHDGQKIEERQLDARFPLTAKGRALCIAAGNDGANGLHADLSFTGKEHAGVLRWSSPAEAYLSVYYDTSDEKDLRYAAAGLDLHEKGSVNPVSGKYVSHFILPAGHGELQFYSDSGGKVDADAYLSGYAGGGSAHFDESCASFNKVIATPGSTHHAITVGSYDWNDQFEQYGKADAFSDPIKGAPLTIGALSTYSSTGPLRSANVIKPDIVAPGQYYAASAARNTRAVRDSSGRYSLFNGTSAATPYTAGVIALVMQKKPDITLGEIKDLLQKYGSHDRFTGPVPNPKWGNGKLDLKAVEQILESTK